MTARRWDFRIRGLVQGVGFRPFVYALARELQLAGEVGNDTEGVFGWVQGEPDELDRFARRVVTDSPPLARVHAVEFAEVAATTANSFRIVPSRSAERVTTLIAPDAVTCADCLAEMNDPADRRYRYPLIACTNCGPRFTIVTGLPYDRAGTTMTDFPLCPDCLAEYEDPASRRFHAQPVACPVCGPRVEFLGPDGDPDHGPAHDQDAIQQGAACIDDGLIVAVKGVGGYHLAVDATNPLAVARLRKRKARLAKPFAVLVPNLEAAGQIVRLDEHSRALLTSPAGPIVLAPVAAGGCQLIDAVAPGLDRIGVMLPPSGVHHLLLAAARSKVWVFTSGNLSGEPICTDDADAMARLADPEQPIADAIVRHNRRIFLACDDSVIAADGPILRRSRGYAPLPIAFEAPEPVFAAGGDMKSTIGLSGNGYAYLSQHLGDAATLATTRMTERTRDTCLEVFAPTPTKVAVDLHPGYLSRRSALDYAHRAALPVVEVQHHHAHLASLLAEHGLQTTPVVGIVCDGTGFGSDDTIWGCEILLGDARGFTRAGNLAQVPLPGGDAAIRHPCRTALAYLVTAGVELDPQLPPLRALGESERSVLVRMIETGEGTTPCGSAGRLFDAVASLIGLNQHTDYDAQAAILLEAAARSATASREYSFTLRARPGHLMIDPGHVIAAIAADVLAGEDQAAIAAGFHDAFADALCSAAITVARVRELDTIGLTGGVFANTRLADRARRTLGTAGFNVLIHEQVPCGDGGLALGQLAVASHSDIRPLLAAVR